MNKETTTMTYLLRLLRLLPAPAAPAAIPAHRWNRATVGGDIHAYRWCNHAPAQGD